MPRSSSPYEFEQITGEIVFSHLTASMCQSIMLPKAQHRSRSFSPNTQDNKLAFTYTKELLIIDQHPNINFEKLEADLFFRFSFDQILNLHIPPDLQEVLFILGECQTPVYTDLEKAIDTVLNDNHSLAMTLFPDQSPATIDNDTRLWSNDSSTIIRHRYCVFESTLKVDDLNGKLLQLERLIAFCTARHLCRLLKCRSLSSTDPRLTDLVHIIENIKSNRFKHITRDNMSIITSITLSCLGFAGFSMPVNQKSKIVELLNNANTSSSTEKCKFYFLNALLNTGRLLFYYVNDTEQGWRASVLTSMSMLSERISSIELLQRCIKDDVKQQALAIKQQATSIDKIFAILNGTTNRPNTNKDVLRKMDSTRKEITEKVNYLEHQINLKIDKIEKGTNEQFKEIINLMTLHQKKKNRICSCVLF
jgi:hypothetical protein